MGFYIKPSVISSVTPHVGLCSPRRITTREISNSCFPYQLTHIKKTRHSDRAVIYILLPCKLGIRQHDILRRKSTVDVAMDHISSKTCTEVCKHMALNTIIRLAHGEMQIAMLGHIQIEEDEINFVRAAAVLGE